MKSLSVNTETRFAVYVVEILYENIPLTEMIFLQANANKLNGLFRGLLIWN